MRFYTKNFVLPESDRSFVNMKIEEILEFLPSDTTLCFCISKQNNLLEGTIRLRSLEGQFGCSQSAETLAELLRKISNRLTLEAVEWRLQRFEKHGNHEQYKQCWMESEDKLKIIRHCKQEDCPLHAESNIWVGNLAN